jgi:hypothetical protein
METAVTINLEPIDLSASAQRVRSPGSQITKLEPHYSWKVWTGVGLLALGAGVMTWGIVWVVVDGQGAKDMCAAPGGVECRSVYDTRGRGWILAAAGGVSVAAGSFLLYSSGASGTDVIVSVGPRGLALGGRF